MTASQLLVWTALPNGMDDGRDQVLDLSVFLAPQLTATVPMGDAFAPLSLFPDFSDWPSTISSAPEGPITFTVTFDGPGGVLTVPATDVTPAIRPGVDAGAAWRAIFDPDTTQVEPFVFQDYSLRPVHSFPVNQIAAFVGSIYGTIGSISPTDPILLNPRWHRGTMTTGTSAPRIPPPSRSTKSSAGCSRLDGRVTGPPARPAPPCCRRRRPPSTSCEHSMPHCPTCPMPSPTHRPSTSTRD